MNILKMKFKPKRPAGVTWGPTALGLMMAGQCSTWNIRAMKGAIKMYNVYMTTGFYGVKRILASFPTYGEAAAFCEENNWEYIDENEFQWDLDIE